MTVEELMDRLKDCDPKDIVMLGYCKGGKFFRPLDQIDQMIYSSRDEDIYIPEITDALREKGYTEEDVYDGIDGVDAVDIMAVRE